MINNKFRMADGGGESSKIKRISSLDFDISTNAEEEKYRSKYLPDPTTLVAEKLVCTVCSSSLAKDVHNGNKIYEHPFLHVLMCKNCYDFYDEGDFSSDDDGDDKYCRWCGQGGQLFLCTACTCAFCSDCLTKNLKPSALARVEDDDWKCFVCVPRPLFGSRTICWGARSLNDIGKEKSKEKRGEERNNQGETSFELSVKEQLLESSMSEAFSDDEPRNKRKFDDIGEDDSSPVYIPVKKNKLNGKVSAHLFGTSKGDENVQNNNLRETETPGGETNSDKLPLSDREEDSFIGSKPLEESNNSQSKKRLKCKTKLKSKKSNVKLEIESDSEEIKLLKHKIRELIKKEYATSSDSFVVEPSEDQKHTDNQIEDRAFLDDKLSENVDDESNIKEEVMSDGWDDDQAGDGEVVQPVTESDNEVNSEQQTVVENMSEENREQQTVDEFMNEENGEQQSDEIMNEKNNEQHPTDKIINEENSDQQTVDEIMNEENNEQLKNEELTIEDKDEQQTNEDLMNIDIKIEADDNFGETPIEGNVELSADIVDEENVEVQSEQIEKETEAVDNSIAPSEEISPEKVEENVKAAIIWMNDIANEISELASIISDSAISFGENKVNLDKLCSYKDVIETSDKLKQFFHGIYSNYAEIENNLESKFQPWKISAGLEQPEEETVKGSTEKEHLEDADSVSFNLPEENVNALNTAHIEDGDPSKVITKSIDVSKTCNISDENINSDRISSVQGVDGAQHLKEAESAGKEEVEIHPTKDDFESLEPKSIINTSNNFDAAQNNESVFDDNENSDPNVRVNNIDKGLPSIIINENDCTKINNEPLVNKSNEENGSFTIVDKLELSNLVSDNNQQGRKEDILGPISSDNFMDKNQESTATDGDDCNEMPDIKTNFEHRDSDKNKIKTTENDPENFEALQQMLYSSSDNDDKASSDDSDDSDDVELEDSDVDLMKPIKNITKSKRPKKKLKERQPEKNNKDLKEKDEPVTKPTKKVEEELDSEAEIDLLTDLNKLKKKTPSKKFIFNQSSNDESEEESSDDDVQGDEKKRKYIKKNNEVKKRREEDRKELFGFLDGDSSSEDEIDISKNDLDKIEDQYASSSSDSMSLEVFTNRMNAKWKELDKEQEDMNLQLLLAADSESGSAGEDLDINLESDDEKKKKKKAKKIDEEDKASIKSEDKNANKEDENIETDVKVEPDAEYELFVEGLTKNRTIFKGLGSSSEESEKDVESDDEDDEIDVKKEPKSDNGKIKKERKGSDKSSDSESSADLFMNKDKKKAINKTWRNHRLLRIKLSDTDTSDEERWWQRRLEKEQKKKEEQGDRPKKELEPRTKKKKSFEKKIKKKSEDDGNSSSTMELSSTDSSGSSVFKKKKRKKDQSSDSDVILISDDDKKKKKKRKRGLDSSDESNDSGDDIIDISQKSTQGESPGKGGRKNIRKVLTKHELAAATKAAAKEEEERKKRIAARQKMFNEIFEIKEAEVLEKLVLDFDPDTKTELISVDKDLVTKMKPHQAKGVKFMWDSCFESLTQLKTKKGSGCILAHCMGLGKTFQVISLVHTILKHKDTNVKTVLVVCPLSTVLNWYGEFGKWLDDVRGGRDIKIYHLTKYKQTHERARQLTQWHRTGGVMIIGYEMFRILSNESSKKFRLQHKEIFKKTLIDPGSDLVVCDEGHMLKNESTILSKAMSKIKTLRRIVLTGTPMQNNLKEYHCMVQFVKPNLLGTRREFLNQFVNPITNGQFVDSTETDVKVMKRRAHVLHKMLEGLVQRFDYSVLTPFLPPKHEYVISVRLSDVQVKLYQFYLDNFSQMGGNNTQTGSKLFSDWQALGRIWTHPLVLKMSTDKAEKEREKQPELGGQRTLFDLGFKSKYLRSGKLVNVEVEDNSDSSEDDKLEESEEEGSVKDSSSSLCLSSSHSSSSSDSDEDEAEKEKRREAQKQKKLERERKKLEYEKKKLEKEKKKLEMCNEKETDKGNGSISEKKEISNSPEIEEEINLISSDEEEKNIEKTNKETEETNVEPLVENAETNLEETVNSEENVVENSDETSVVNLEENLTERSNVDEENSDRSKKDNETGEVECSSNDDKVNDNIEGVQVVKDNEKEKDHKEGKLDKVGAEEQSKKKAKALDCRGSWWKDIIEPKHFDDINQSAKLILLFAILRECEMIEDKVLVFSQSLFSLDLIEYFLEKVDQATKDNRLDESLGNNAGLWTKGLDYFRLDGSSSSENRSMWCKSFNREDNPRARLFLISTRAGGLGINLTAANRVIIFDASWNPSHDVQSIFRIYRFGQKKACYVYRFIAHGTMEEKVYERQVAKQSLSSRVVDEQQVHRHFSMNDLSELYTFTPPTNKERPTPALPKDRLMAELLTQYNDWIEKYHEHDSLLENVVEEELNEEERKLAWEDFENDKKRGVLPPPGTTNFNPVAQQMELFRSTLRKKYPKASEAEINAMLQTLMYQFNTNSTVIGPGMPQTSQAQTQPGFQSSNQTNLQNRQTNLTAQQIFNLQRNHLLQKWGPDGQQQGQNQMAQFQDKAGSNSDYMSQMRAQQEANLNRVRNQAIIQNLIMPNNVDKFYPQNNRNIQPQQGQMNRQQSLLRRQQQMTGTQSIQQNRQQPAARTQQQPVQNYQQFRSNQNRQPIQNRQQPIQNRQPPIQNRQPPIQNRQPPIQNRQPPIQNRQPPIQNRQQSVENRQIIQPRQPQQRQFSNNSTLQNRQNQRMGSLQNARNVNSAQPNMANKNTTPLLPRSLLNNRDLQISRVKSQATTAAEKTRVQEEMRKRVLHLQQQKQIALQREQQQKIQSNTPGEEQRKRLEEMKNRYKASRKNLPRSMDLDADVVEIVDEPTRPSGSS